MKILFFIRTTEKGEIKRSDFRDIIKSLKQKGDEVHIYDTAINTHYRINDEGKLSKISESKPMTRKGIMSAVSRLSALWSFCLRNKNKYDVAHFCYIREEFLLLWFCVIKTARNNIVTVYGADVGQRNIIKKYFRQFLYSVDIITITGTNASDLLKKYFDFERLQSRVVTLPLPSIILKEISLKKKSREEIKEELGFDKDDVVVVCGSVLSPNEQYEKWVPFLGRCLSTGRKIVFVFPFAYGNVSLLPFYREIIELNLPAGSYRIIEGWSGNEETADLRIVTDILISLRKNDQFAGIIAESIYTGAILITGSWLKYSYFTDNDIWHLRINDFEDLPGKLSEALDIVVHKDKVNELARNRKKISDDFSYDPVFNLWVSFFEKIREGADEHK